MAGTPSNAQILVTTCTHGGTAIGIVTEFTWTWVKDVIPIRDEGSTNDDALGVVGTRLEAEVTSLYSPIADTMTPGSLVLKTITVAGATKTCTLTNMVPINCTKVINRDSPPAMFKQTFRTLGTATFPTEA